MQHRLLRLHALVFSWRHIWTEEFLALFLALIILGSSASAIIRFEPRSLFMLSNEPGATTSYTISFGYVTPVPIGSVDMLFCDSPIPYLPCVAPAGLDVSNTSLANQTGENNFSILSKSTNHIVLTRAPQMVTNNDSSYTFDNIKNPTDTSQAFAIRLRSHSTTDATGPQVDVGSVRGQVASGIQIETQVPPILLFCAAEQVADNCTSTNENYYSDMGQLGPDSTLTAQSQMVVGTNATGGFAITANGTPMAAGTSVIDSPTTPTASVKGTNQFGINLVANNAPTVGSDPDGPFANAITSLDYGISNKYKYVSGDVVAFSPNVSLMKRFTVSYIVNSSPNLRAGVYTTTITYIASGRF